MRAGDGCLRQCWGANDGIIRAVPAGIAHRYKAECRLHVAAVIGRHSTRVVGDPMPLAMLVQHATDT